MKNELLLNQIQTDECLVNGESIIRTVAGGHVLSHLVTISNWALGVPLQSVSMHHIQVLPSLLTNWYVSWRFAPVKPDLGH